LCANFCVQTALAARAGVPLAAKNPIGQVSNRRVANPGRDLNRTTGINQSEINDFP
jgi:hypothetical protein